MPSIHLPSSLRTLARHPGSSLTAIVVLALGVGLTTAMFSIVGGFLLRQLPVDHPDQLVYLKWAESGGDHGYSDRKVSSSDFAQWRREQSSFADLAAFGFRGVSVSDGALARRYQGARISAHGFDLLGVAPVIGRPFTAADARPGAPPTVLLGHSVWRSHLAADPSVIGREILVDGVPTVVVGVMPEGFQFPLREDVWLPLTATTNAVAGANDAPVDVFGRLRDDVGLEQARLEMSLLASRLDTHNETTSRIVVTPYAAEFMGGSRRDRTIQVGLGAGLFVLLIACANVTNLLLARAHGRERETAVRAALGAGRLRLLRRSLSESLALALPAAVLGLGLATFGVRLLATAVGGASRGDWPYWIELAVGPREAMVGLGLALVAALLTGIVPGLRAGRRDLLPALTGAKAVRRRSGKLSLSLVSGQVALATVLLVGTGLMVRSLVNLATLDFPIDAERVLAGDLVLPEEHYPDDASLLRFWRSLDAELQSYPETLGFPERLGSPQKQGSALSDTVPGPYVARRVVYRTPEQRSVEAESAPWTHRAVVSPGSFRALGAELIEGRDFTTADDEHALRIAIVNRSLAQREWPDQSPIGRQLLLGEDAASAQTVTVVGVAPDLYMDGLREVFPSGIYLPLAQHPPRALSIVMRTSGDPKLLLPSLRQRVASVDPGLPLFNVQTLSERLTEGMFFYRMVATIFTVLGAAALLLAATGLYAILAASVSRRSTEMGIRMALGATAREVKLLVVRQGVLRVVAGLAVGLLVAPVFALGLSRNLYGVEPLDLATFVTIPVLLVAVAIIASLAPAMRATRVDPAHSLRAE